MNPYQIIPRGPRARARRGRGHVHDGHCEDEAFEQEDYVAIVEDRRKNEGAYRGVPRVEILGVQLAALCGGAVVLRSCGCVFPSVFGCSPSTALSFVCPPSGGFELGNVRFFF